MATETDAGDEAPAATVDDSGDQTPPDSAAVADPSDDDEAAAPVSEEESSDVVMPNVVGLLESAATTELSGLGVDDVRYIDKESNDPEGTVLEQLPSPGASVGGPVTLTVAVPLPPMPDYSGRRYGDVQTELENWGITVTRELVLSTDRPDGEVLETTPPAGQRIGTEVVVTVSAAPVTGQLATDDAPLIEDGGNGISPYVGQPVEVNGILYENSLFGSGSRHTDAGDIAVWEFNLGRDWEIFEATVGLTDDSEFEQRGRFRVLLDGATIWEQDDVKFGEDEAVSLNVADGLRLRLEVVALDDGRVGLAWGSPKLLGVEGQVPQAQSDE